MVADLDINVVYYFLVC